MKAPLYTYRAKYVKNYDGDTVTVDMDLGFGVWLRNQTLRLYGIDTPEMRGEEKERGKEVRDLVAAILQDAGSIVVETFKDKAGKYGRWLAVIWCDGENLNQRLIDEGHAKAYYGGKR